jgi:hypothetical protein
MRRAWKSRRCHMWSSPSCCNLKFNAIECKETKVKALFSPMQ